MLDKWAKAMLLEGHTRPVVLCRALLPYSLGHSFILRASGSPYTRRAVPHREDLIAAVWICSHTWEQLRGGAVWTSVRESVFRWGRAVRKADFARENDAFGDYIEAYLDRPRRWPNPADSQHEIRAPWEMHAVHVLLEIGVARDEDAAWNTPVCRACAWSDVRAEARSLASGQEYRTLMSTREYAAAVEAGTMSA